MNQVLDVENFFRETTGEESYLIPVGGSNTIGVFGFLTVFDDIQSSVSSLHLKRCILHVHVLSNTVYSIL